MFNTQTGEIDFMNLHTLGKAIYFEGGKFVVGNVPESEVEQAVNMVKSLVNSYMEIAKSVVYPIEDSIIAEQYGYSYQDGTAAKPPDIYDKLSEKNGVPHKKFKERVLSGEIMMSNYSRYNVRVITSAGYQKLGTNNPYSAHLLWSAFLDTGKLVPKRDYEGKIKYLLAGSSYVVDVGLPVARYGRIGTRGEWVFPTAPSANSVLTSMLEDNPSPNPMITRAAAYANKRSVDVLTAFAEMPKTIGSALRGLSNVASIIRDIKKGQFDLTKAHAFRKKVITERYHKRIALLDNRILNPRLSRKQRNDLTRQRDKATLSMRDTLSRSAQELADALANLWLNYRYNIMPNVYLLQDIERALARFDHEFITARSKQVSDKFISGPGWRLDYQFTQRCVIKRRFGDPSRFTAGGPQISADIFTTAWELVPLSFVIDWFVRIGDFLAAFSFKNDWDAQGACLSELAKISGTINYFPDDQWIIDPKVRIDAFYYKRLNINPTNYIGVCWQPNLDLARKTDALALIWRPVRSLLNSKR